MDLVKIIRNDIFTDSMVIAEGTGNKHKNVKELIQNYKADLQDFGTLSVLNGESKGGRPEQYYRLNEQQATFLITLLRNSEAVTAFKKELVRQFFTMRTVLAQKQTQVYKDTRSYQKAIRQQETDAIRSLVEYAESQGSSNAARYYTSLTKLADKTAGITDRERATMEQLGALALIENIIARCILDGIDLQEPYKDIYLECKRKLEQFRTAAFIQ